LGNQRPNIMEFHDYREFIQEWIKHLLATDKSFTLESLSKRADLSQDYLQLFLENKASLTVQALGRMLPFLALNVFEKNYLKLLRKLSETESHKERIETLDRIRETQLEKVSHQGSLFEEHRYLSKWYYVAIREMSHLPGFKAEAQWVQDHLRLKVSLNEIQQAIDYLKKNELLGSEKELNANGGAYRLAMGQFHHEMLALAQDAILTVPRRERGILAQTVAIDQDTVDEARQIFGEAMSKISALGTRKSKKQAVYHFEVALFPLTQTQPRRMRYVRNK
jgi:uncharacterized protein (TIGR02147 family)